MRVLQTKEAYTQYAIQAVSFYLEDLGFKENNEGHMTILANIIVDCILHPSIMARSIHLYAETSIKYECSVKALQMRLRHYLDRCQDVMIDGKSATLYRSNDLIIKLFEIISPKIAK